MPKLEELGRTTNVVVVEMCEGDDVVAVSLGIVEILAKFRRQIDALVQRVVSASGVGVVEEHLLADREINAAAICVAEREDRDLVHNTPVCSVS